MKIALTKDIEQPVDRVFDIFTDLEGAADRIEGIKSLDVLTSGPVGKGTRFRETRVMFKRDATEEMTITSFEPNQRYSVDCLSCGCHYETVFEFLPKGSSTRVEVTLQMKPVTFMAKLMSPLGRLFAGTALKCFERDLDDLKTSLERSR